MRSKLLAALLISEALHLVVLGLMADITIAASPEGVLVVSSIDDDPDLISPDIGNDPDLPLNYNLPRIEDIDIPGPVEPDEPARPLDAAGTWTR